MKSQIDIIVSLCPLRSNPEWIKNFVSAGMSIARINASHSNLAEIKGMVLSLRSTVPSLPIMLDLPGPEYRLDGFEADLIVAKDQSLRIYRSSNTQKVDCISANFPVLEGSSVANAILRFMNGELCARLIAVNPDWIEVQFQNGGVLRPHAHLSISSIKCDLPYLSENDSELIQYAQIAGIEYLALSMVSSGKDIIQVKKLLSDTGIKHKPLLCVKFETAEALEFMPEIISEGSAFFVARGDLAHAIDPELIPLVQKEIVKHCNNAGKPVFLATQILSTMAINPYPLRAEISDLANAIWEGFSGITLSEESAIGDYPLEAVSTVKRMISKVREGSLPYLQQNIWEALWREPSFLCLIDKIKDIADRIWQSGWAEANAGNLSINITDMISSLNLSESEVSSDTKQKISPQEQNKSWYLVSRTGSRYREFAVSPKQCLVLICVDRNTEVFFPKAAKATSEWISHLSIHQLFEKSGREEKVILHAHPKDIISLSHLPEYGDELVEKLYQALPEMQIYLPQGFALTSFSPPGSCVLAEKSLAALQSAKVIVWQYHGLLCCGKDLDMAFDYLEIVTKAAAVYMQIRGI